MPISTSVEVYDWLLHEFSITRRWCLVLKEPAAKGVSCEQEDNKQSNVMIRSGEYDCSHESLTRGMISPVNFSNRHENTSNEGWAIRVGILSL